MEDEWVDRVDDEDLVIGRIRRSELIAARANHRVVHVFLFTSRGELLIHKLAADRGRYPGHWGSSVAGTVKAGENPDAAAARELAEELGVHASPRFLGKTAVDEAGRTKFLYLYGVVHDGAVSPAAEEIAEVEYAPLAVVRERLRAHERPFTPTFEVALDLFDRVGAT